MGKHRNRKIDPSKAEYDIGYCKTAQHSWFSSDNQPKNRRGAGSKQRKQKDVEHYLNEKVSVPQKDGTTLRLTRRELGNRNLANKYASGDLKAIAACEERERRRVQGEEADPLIFDPALRRELLSAIEDDIRAQIERTGLRSNDEEDKDG